MPKGRGATSLAGVLAVDKPSGMTSHDVIAALRRATGERRIGHAGTLDPMATGLLVVLLGPFTRLAQYLTAERKSYQALVVFGEATDTLDADGTVVERRAVPDEALDPVEAACTVAALVGEHEQAPPAYSAVKVAGRSSHEMARKGEAPAHAARPVTVHSAELLEVLAEPPSWRFKLEVSKGTYVRCIARDLGEAMGSVAHLGELRRLSSGELRLEQAHPLAEVIDFAERGDLPDIFADPVPALGLPALEVDASAAALVADGRPLPSPDGCDAGRRTSLLHRGDLLGVYRCENGTLKAETVLPRVEKAAR